MKLDVMVQRLREAGLLRSVPDHLPEIAGVTDDSRAVKPGFLFCAVHGTARDGHDFLDDARRRGAVAALVSDPRASALPVVTVRDDRAAAAVAAVEWYGHASKKIRLVGVTGTNGKSTTVSLIRHVLNAEGTVGSIGTVGVFDGRGQRLTGYHALTTPGAIEFHAMLAELHERGVTTVALEASSHGLDQGRLASVQLEAAVYTNATHEHLDYHPSFAAYAQAKMKLSSLLCASGLEVVNADDPTWNALPERRGGRRMRYGTGLVDVCAVNQQFQRTGSDCLVRFGHEEHRVRLPLVGDYNVLNALAAAATAWGLGEAPAHVAERLADAPSVPGRMETIATTPFTVMRDYAHTPDGFERALGAVRPITSGRVLFLFGAGGDRDRSKRPLMGKVAADQADLVIITSDNPRSEDPEDILDQIAAGMNGVAHLRITDREEAIRQAVTMLEPGDCLLLAGKGPETYQEIGSVKHPFDERAIVESVLAQLGRA